MKDPVVGRSLPERERYETEHHPITITDERECGEYSSESSEDGIFANLVSTKCDHFTGSEEFCQPSTIAIITRIPSNLQFFSTRTELFESLTPRVPVEEVSSTTPSIGLSKKGGRANRRMSDASSSPSSVEHGIEDMMLTDSMEVEENKPIGGKDEAEHLTTEEGTTRGFAKTLAPSPTGISTSNPTQLGFPPTHYATKAVTLEKSTLLPTVKNPKHDIDNKMSANDDDAAPLIASSIQEEADRDIEQTTSNDQTLSESELIIDKVLGTKEEDFLSEENAAAKDHEDRKPPFRLPQNNSTESFPKMSVSSTPSNSPPADSTGKKKPRKSSKSSRPKDGQSSGRWTDEEHQAFLRGLHTYGREWKKVASHIPTRTSAQVRSHAQKYFAKLQKEEDSWAGSFVSAEGGGTGAPNAVSIRDDASGHGGVGGSPAAAAAGTVSSSVQANVERIMAHPESVEAEVEDTLRQLRERYEALQRRLEQTSAQRADTPNRKRRSPHHPLVPDDKAISYFAFGFFAKRGTDCLVGPSRGFARGRCGKCRRKRTFGRKHGHGEPPNGINGLQKSQA